MKRILVVLTLTTSAMTATAWGATPASAAGCADRQFCVFTAENYTGRMDKLASQSNGTCVQLWDRRYSFQNNTNIEGYLYRYGDCTGQSYAVKSGSKAPKLSFPATGFKYACVSCRE